MENPRLECQKMIDQTTGIYATIYSGIVVFSVPHISLSSSNKLSALIIISCLLLVVSFVWWFKINAWNNLLKAELAFKMEHDEEFKKYNEFIINELRKKKEKEDSKRVLFTNYPDDLIPKLLLIFSFVLIACCMVITILHPSLK